MFQLVAARRGAHWQLSPVEREQLGDALANVLRHVPLPERELGIAADVAALGFVCYAIAAPRVEHDRRLDGAPAPAAVAPLERAGMDRVERVLRDRLNGEPLNLQNPRHVEVLNQLADEGLIASGPAVGTHTAPVYPPFDPANNGATVNDPNAVIEGLDPS